MNCRFDGLPLSHIFINLGYSPPSNSFLTRSQLQEPEVSYPLKLWVSERTFLVQIDELKRAEEIFNNNYVYFSSFSTSWLDHCKRYADMMIKRFGLNQESQIIEIASNDGYLLQYFYQHKIPVLGVEPTGNTADAAIKKGITTIKDFFGVNLAKQLVKEEKSADLLIGNNVLAHVPDLNDFVAGMKTVLKRRGVITLEFPHLMQLILNNQFDTIYHEHFSYFLLFTVNEIFKSHGLEIFDVEEIPTHGGSLRVFLQHEHGPHKTSINVEALIEKERKMGMLNLETYKEFYRKVKNTKLDLLQFLVEQRRMGKSVVAYGAAAKGNTLLNYCGIKEDLIPFISDKSPHKQDKFTPGSHIPVVHPDEIKKIKPDFVLVLPWNIKEEIFDELNFVRDWNGQFVTAIPSVKIEK